ncbi:MAG TPA: CoA-acylating methylmalonate-semialdehyde dehydrogenase [Acidimicrobiales bacterium]|nr:CoA-acylating methylmalonate-semialdehyde dehydrogenase [Acidimicrobiales bacterium]
MRHVTHLVANEPWSKGARRTGDLVDPATGRVTGTVDLAGAEEVDAAVAAASAASHEWRTCSLARRTELLFRLRDLLARRGQEVAELVSAEHGKVRSDALGEVRRGLEVVELACGIGELVKGEHSREVSSGIDACSLREPLGVVAGITPFNFPAMVPLWLVPLALACGNTFVLKPSEKAPAAPSLLAALFAEAGFPPGVLNVVHGDAEAAAALVAHPEVAAVSFVGSTATARAVYGAAAAQGKRVQALGGAKNHLVVLEDADLDAAADAAVSGAFGSSGERCMAVSVVVAVGGVGDALVARLRERAARIALGPATDPRAEMGPLISRPHLERVLAYLESGVAAGARLVLDGRQHPTSGEPGGFWLGPCLFDCVEPGMPIYDDEIFGPLLCVVRVATLAEALGLVRANPYGNGAAVFTRDGAAARVFEREVPVGMVGVNVPVPAPVATHPFGGWKASLFGDLHVCGPDAIRFYTRLKVVTSRWAPPPPAGPGLAFPTRV